MMGRSRLARDRPAISEPISEAQSMQVDCICEFCRKPFSIPSSRIRTPTQGRFCRLKCHRDSTIRSIEDRFWECVDKSGECWLWTKGKDRDGYGAIRGADGKNLRAHRVSWIIHFGPIPDGLYVLHDCPDGKDNPSCVRPSHLWLGTNDDNMADCHDKKRNVFGERHGRAKLTEEIVLEIRRLHKSGVAQKTLAAKYLVNRVSINYIIARKTWTHI